ncbi:LysR family transcriptional regulator [Halopseudomonas pachastrellae]|nr:LysR family transcriptional regulator [Halopseudomonas pachastrellae]
MTLQQLRSFIALAETLNFSRAAEQLNMTQPPAQQADLGAGRERRHPAVLASFTQRGANPGGRSVSARHQPPAD